MTAHDAGEIRELSAHRGTQRRRFTIPNGENMSQNSKPKAGVSVRRIAFESRADLLGYLNSHGVRWNELNKLKKK
jgi:hypothetical protein